MSQDVRLQIIALLPRLRRFAHALTGSLDSGDDLVQAACERSLASLHQWPPSMPLEHWLLGAIRDAWLAGHGDGGLAEGDLPADAAPQPLQEAEISLSAVRAVMAGLSREHRLVLALISVSGLSYRAAAEVMGVTVTTVMSRMARARLRLHESVFGAVGSGQARRAERSA